MEFLPEKIELRLVIGTLFRWKPYFYRNRTWHGFEFSWLGVYVQTVIPKQLPKFRPDEYELDRGESPR